MKPASKEAAHRASACNSTRVLLVLALLETGRALRAPSSEASSELAFDGRQLEELAGPIEWACERANQSRVNLVSFASNRIREVQARPFACIRAELKIIILSDNQIERISDEAFEELDRVQVLLLDSNKLKTVPSRRTMEPLRSLRHLNLAHNQIEWLQDEAIASATLISLDLKGNPLHRVASDALVRAPRLETLILSQTDPGHHLDRLNGLGRLKYLHVDQTRELASVDANLCSTLASLASLILKSNQLQRVPQFAHCQNLLLMDLSYNKITGTLSENFTNQPNLIDLYLDHNRLSALDEHAFAGLQKLQLLQLNDNQLKWIHPAAFIPLRGTLDELNLSNNPQLAELSPLGFDRLLTFSAFGNPSLRRLPYMAAASSLTFTYAYHCCDYLADEGRDRHHQTNWLRLILNWTLRALIGEPLDPTTSGAAPTGRLASWTSSENLTELVLWPSGERLFDTQLPVSPRADNRSLARCRPSPSAFMPCHDLFDTWWLRLGVWCVFSLAFGGNLLVILVLCSVRQSSSASALTSIMWLTHSKRHIDVPRFLVINLAVADLLLAVYLGILAFVDLSTLGEFKLFAIKWQHSSGCKTAGFLGVLSSELSVFILAIITLERNYAITNAVHLNRRLSLQKAALIMLLGYTFAFAMALLPLQGVNDYSKYSICLPLDFDPANPASQAYIWTLLSINTFSFLLLLSCYLRMYCAIRGSQAWNSNDLRIARRMSILVVTDFLCWTPIIVAALSSLLGHHLVSHQGIKTLTIFILPLNSVANPFLYAITTKKFKRDLRTLKRRLGSILTLSKTDDRVWRDVCLATSNKHPGKFPNRKLIDGQLLALNKRERTLIRATKGGGGGAKGRIEQALLADTTNRVNQVTLNRTSVCCSCMRQMQPRIVLDIDEPAAGAPKGTTFRRYPVPQPADLNKRLMVRKSVSMHSAIEGPCESVNLKPLRLSDNIPKSSVISAILVPQDKHLGVSFEPTNRSASACGYQQVRPSSSQLATTPTTVIGVSCEGPSKLGDSRSKGSLLSGSINKLLFEPLAKAWSSIQISLNSSVGHANTPNGARSELICECSLDGSLHNFDETLEDPSPNYLNDIYVMTSPSHRLLQADRGRRMSRSCDLLVLDSSTSVVSNSSGVLNQDTQTGTSTTQASQDDDDRRVLLATINRLAAGGHEPALEIAARNERYLRNRCTRCRSWSPALLGKLEDCIYQIKSRFTTSTRHQTCEEQDSDESSEHSTPLEAPTSIAEIVEQKSEQESDSNRAEVEDNFSELANFRTLFGQRDRQHGFRRQQVRRTQTQSSTNSDTLSTRTAGTLATTMSLSLDSSDENQLARDLDRHIEKSSRERTE